MSLDVEDLYARQIKPLAEAEKLRLVELIAQELASKNGDRQRSFSPETAERKAARDRFRRHAGAVSLGYATPTDNLAIDADLGSG